MYTYRTLRRLALQCMLAASLVCCLFPAGAFGQSTGSASLRLSIAEVQGLKLSVAPSSGMASGSTILSDHKSGFTIGAGQQLNLIGNSAVWVSQSVYRGADVLNLLRRGFVKVSSNYRNQDTFGGKVPESRPEADAVFPNRQSSGVKAGSSEKEASCLLIYNIYPL